jgi:DNA-formamidopyrimidine glycosylase
MPEGAEAKLFAESLARAVSGKDLLTVDVLSGRYKKSEVEGLELLKARLPTKVVGVGVHGKFIYWIVSNDVFIYNTLGMTGSWSMTETKHSRVLFQMSGDTKVYFNDQRNFGTLKMVPGRQELVKKLKSLGPDMLSESVSDARFTEALMKRPDWSLSEALMDQSLVSGVGNYVKAESLYRAQLSPYRTVSSLSATDFSRLRHSIQHVLQDAYTRGGASIQTYRDFDGNEGEYSQRFLVYNQDQDPNGNKVVREQTADGRTTHWVPAVQK